MANTAIATSKHLDTALNPAFMTDLLVADVRNLPQRKAYGNRSALHRRRIALLAPPTASIIAHPILDGCPHEPAPRTQRHASQRAKVAAGRARHHRARHPRPARQRRILLSIRGTRRRGISANHGGSTRCRQYLPPPPGSDDSLWCRHFARGPYP